MNRSQYLRIVALAEALVALKAAKAPLDNLASTIGLRGRTLIELRENLGTSIAQIAEEIVKGESA